MTAFSKRAYPTPPDTVTISRAILAQWLRCRLAHYGPGNDDRIERHERLIDAENRLEAEARRVIPGEVK
jgi:hypothetical protein